MTTADPKPDTAKDAARLLHAALQVTTWHLRAHQTPSDSQTRLMLEENASLLELTKEIAGRKES